jgi:hypothetical protein
MCVAIAYATAYELPDGVADILQFPIRSTFDCTNRPYGYYADVDNDCKIFHVCYPVMNELSQVIN